MNKNSNTHPSTHSNTHDSNHSNTHTHTHLALSREGVYVKRHIPVRVRSIRLSVGQNLTLGCLSLGGDFADAHLDMILR